MLKRVYDQAKTTAIRPFINKRGSQCYILSYPKCGRTWLRLLIGKVLCDQFGCSETQMLDTYQLTAVPHVLRTHFSHDYASIKAGFPYNRMPTNKQEYANTKVLFLIRDIRDTLVSSYFQATKRVNRFQGPISEFVRSEKYGVKKIVAYYNIWHTNQSLPRDFMLLHYETLHQAPLEALRQTLQFMELKPIDDTLLETAVAFAQFDNMKKMEASGLFKSDKMQPGQTQDEDSFKVRQGKIGSYKEHLSADDLTYIDQIIAEMGCPFIHSEGQGIGDQP